MSERIADVANEVEISALASRHKPQCIRGASTTGKGCERRCRAFEQLRHCSAVINTERFKERAQLLIQDHRTEYGARTIGLALKLVIELLEIFLFELFNPRHRVDPQ